MPSVEVSDVIPASASRVWDAINDVESYPRMMDHVRSLQVIERGPNFRVTEWHGELKGCVMRWTEHEEVHREQWRVDYRQVKGDMAQFEGHWQIEPLSDDSCRVTLVVRFDIGIPMLCDMLNPVAERAVRENSQQMLRSIAAEVAQVTAPAEQKV